jgi:hypothetical protein
MYGYSDSPPLGMSNSQWQTHFGAIRTMCHSLQIDPELSQCSNTAAVATETLQRVCCTEATQVHHCPFQFAPSLDLARMVLYYRSLD